MLQWSHAQLSVETFAGWNSLPLLELLQWSHAQLSVETRSRSVGLPVQGSLQWSHAQLSVETRARVFGRVKGAHASMEPRSAERGNPAAQAAMAARRRRFNGATLS